MYLPDQLRQMRAHARDVVKLRREGDGIVKAWTLRPKAFASFVRDLDYGALGKGEGRKIRLKGHLPVRVRMDELQFPGVQA